VAPADGASALALGHELSDTTGSGEDNASDGVGDDRALVERCRLPRELRPSLRLVVAKLLLV